MRPRTGRVPDPSLTPLQLVHRQLTAAGSRPGTTPESWTCPAHDDTIPSLSVGEGPDGRVLLHCHAGCEFDTILDALGMEAHDLFPRVIHPELGRAVAVYSYMDEHGRVLFQVCRFQPKHFRPRRPDGKWTLDGVRLVPYRLPDVMAAVRNRQPVYVVEGEKDADRLDRAGVVATCNPGGAGKWRPEYSEHFRGADVAVVADRDDAGYRHARQVVGDLASVARSVREVEPKSGNDATDHLDAGHKVEEFVDRAEAPTVGPDDTARLLAQVAEFVRRFVVFQSEAQVVAVALWTLHTHAFKASETTPYLHIRSAAKRSGKSRLLDVLDLLVAQPMKVAMMSASALYRSIEAEEPTVLFDEVDAVFKGKADDSNETLRAVLNAGYQSGTPVRKVGTKGRSLAVEQFSTFCPKALTGIGRLPDTVGDRCIPIELKRKRPTDRAQRFYRRDVKGEAAPLRLALVTWADGATGLLATARPELPEALNDRAADVWEPLFAIADLAGGDWSAKARRAALELHVTEEDDDVAVLLLRHIRDAFNDPSTDYLPTEALLQRLVDRDDGPWAGWWGRDVDHDDANRMKGPAAKLARMLAPFGIKPGQVKRGGENIRGYRHAAFEEAWVRYLPRGSDGEPGASRLNVATTLPRRSEAVLGRDGPEAETGPDQGGSKVASSGTGPRRKRVRRRTG